jgi:hypothetical protein
MTQKRAKKDSEMRSAQQQHAIRIRALVKALAHYAAEIDHRAQMERETKAKKG